MTKIRHVLTLPVKRAIKPYDDRIDVMENLINLDNRTKSEEYSRHGIYNKKCKITENDRGNPMAIC